MPGSTDARATTRRQPGQQYFSFRTERVVVSGSRAGCVRGGVHGGRYELAMGLEHPAPNYPVVGADSAAAFAADVDEDALRAEAGATYAEVTLGLLVFDAGRRMSLADAAARLAAGIHEGSVSVSVCGWVGVCVGERVRVCVCACHCVCVRASF